MQTSVGPKDNNILISVFNTEFFKILLRVYAAHNRMEWSACHGTGGLTSWCSRCRKPLLIVVINLIAN